MSYLKQYLKEVNDEESDEAAISFYAGLDTIAKNNSLIAETILKELKDQRSFLKLIASENYCSFAVQFAMGNLLTDKYSEGYVHHRFYAGCDNVDTIEDLAIKRAKEIFSAEHAYVQPHSGADANLVAIWAILTNRIENKEIEKLNKKSPLDLTKDEHERIRRLMNEQKLMGMSLSSGGHLTHGYPLNVTSKMMHSFPYDVDEKTHLLDYKKLQDQVKEVKPLILIAGYSAYPRRIDFSIMREIADSVGAVLLVDMAHFAGLVAGKVLQDKEDPVQYAHVVTSTTHKTLRGPRGGLILCKNEFKENVDKGCPLVLGGPMPHVMAAKAIAFQEASTPSFSKYAHQVVDNAKVLAEELLSLGTHVETNGTDNHIILFDVYKSFGLTGRQAETVLRESGITVNRNSIYGDTMGPWYTSGIRMGTPAITTLGMKENQMKEIGRNIVKVLKAAIPRENNGKMSKAKFDIDKKVLDEVRESVSSLLSDYILYPELIIDL